MKTSTIGWIIVVLIVLGGGWYWYSMSTAAPAMDSTGSPQAAMGTNGSADQGNMGQSDQGQVQQPMADGAEGSIIGSNLALGIDGNVKVGGNYLIGYTGMTVYTYAKDTGSTSTCYDTCATNWPPYLVGPEDNLTQLKAGVTGKVGTTIRTDGKIQVTYNGHPLYFYIGDKTGSDVNGEGIGGVWYVVKP